MPTTENPTRGLMVPVSGIKPMSGFMQTCVHADLRRWSNFNACQLKDALTVLVQMQPPAPPSSKLIVGQKVMLR